MEFAKGYDIHDLISTDLLNKHTLIGLIKRDEDINRREVAGDSLLTILCRSETSIELVSIALEKAADVDNQGNEDDENYYPNPLHIAIEKNDHKLVELLLAYGADVYALNDENLNSLNVACKKASIKIVLSLMKAKAAVDVRRRADMGQNPDQYDDGYRQMLLSEEKNLDTDKEDDVRKTVLGKLQNSECLKKYDNLLPIIDSAKFMEFATDLTGGNADDKIEVMIVEFETDQSKNFRLEYLHMYNWSYGDSVTRLTLFENGIEMTVIDTFIDGSGINYLIEANNRSALVGRLIGLAEKIKINRLTTKESCYFLVILLSRMIQKNFYSEDSINLDDTLDEYGFIPQVKSTCEEISVDFDNTTMSHIKKRWIDDRKKRPF